MSENCNHNCEGCSVENCSSRIEKLSVNVNSHIKHTIGIISGKGGVGKSLVTSLIAASLNNSKKNTAILDADITGPSIPKTFGIKEKVFSDGTYLYPSYSKNHVGVMSASMLLENEEDPIIWRGVLLGNLVKQFYTETNWGILDYLLIDMPPGTGDIALTTFQSIPMDGIIVVTTPQSLVKQIVVKAIKMAKEMNIPILGVVENMSYVESNSGEKIYVFGKSNTEEIIKEFGLKLLAKIPLKEETSFKVDQGLVEDVKLDEIERIKKYIINSLEGEK